MVLQHLFLPISGGVKYKAIINDLYDSLTIDELKNMKINKQNYMQVQKSRFLGLYSNCSGEITSKADLVLCGTKGCLYTLCPRKEFQHIIDNIHYCANCAKSSISIDEAVVSETDKLDRIFDEDFNDDYVSVFR